MLARVVRNGLVEAVHDVLGGDQGPVGVDGCGVPAFQGSALSMAGAYARLATNSRFAPAWVAMYRLPPVLGGGWPQGAIEPLVQLTW